MNQVHISFVVMLSCLQDAMSDRARYNMSMNNKKGNQFILLYIAITTMTARPRSVLQCGGHKQPTLIVKQR